jgi:hypothetical protein
MLLLKRKIKLLEIVGGMHLDLHHYNICSRVEVSLRYVLCYAFLPLFHSNLNTFPNSFILGNHSGTQNFPSSPFYKTDYKNEGVRKHILWYNKHLTYIKDWKCSL